MKRFVAAAALSIALASCAAPPDVPTVDVSEMEAPVAARIESLRDAVTDAPESPEAWGELGMAFHAHTLYLEAAEAYGRAAELAPDDYRWPYLAGVCRQRVDPADAVAWYERAAAMSPDNAAFYFHFGELLLQSGEGRRAEAQYRAALERNPGSSHALYGLALVAFQQGDVDGARTHLERAADIAPQHGQVQTLLAQVYQRLGEPRLAEIAALAAAARPEESTAVLDPVMVEVDAAGVSSRARSDRGLRYAGERRYEEAEREFRAVLAQRSGVARDHANLGAALAAQRRFDEAVAQFEESLRLDPAETFAHNNLALALADAGRLDEAESHLLEALRIDPSYVEAHHNLGLLHERKGRTDEAVEEYRRTLELQPSHGGATNNLARILASRGQLDEAIELWTSAVAVDPLNLEAGYNLALALIQRGDHGRAIAALEAASRHAPNSSILTRALAWELATAPDASLRDGERAARLAERLYGQLPQQPSSGDVLAAALAETGEFDRAATVAERAAGAAREANQLALAREIEMRRELYRRGEPYRQVR